MKVKRLFLAVGLACFGLLMALWGISAASPVVAGPEPASPQLSAQIDHRATENISPLPNSDWQAIGAIPGDEYGYAVAVGDLDNDAVPDYIVGTPGANNGNGSVSIYLSNNAPTPSVLAAHVLSTTESGSKFGCIWQLFEITLTVYNSSHGLPGTAPSSCYRHCG